jgi:hypothetical protein
MSARIVLSSSLLFSWCTRASLTLPAISSLRRHRVCSKSVLTEFFTYEWSLLTDCTYIIYIYIGTLVSPFICVYPLVFWHSHTLQEVVFGNQFCQPHCSDFPYLTALFNNEYNRLFISWFIRRLCSSGTGTLPVPLLPDCPADKAGTCTIASRRFMLLSYVLLLTTLFKWNVRFIINTF